MSLKVIGNEAIHYAVCYFQWKIYPNKTN